MGTMMVVVISVKLKQYTVTCFMHNGTDMDYRWYNTQQLA